MPECHNTKEKFANEMVVVAENCPVQCLDDILCSEEVEVEVELTLTWIID
jgi:hypothetical protein